MNCKNCKTILRESDKFCNNCSGMVIQNRISVKQLFIDFSDKYLSINNKFLLTFKTMFTNPSDIVNGYINGLRVKYVDPISYFLIAVALGGIMSYLMVKGYLGKMDYSQFEDPNAPFKMQDYMAKISEYNNLIYLSFMPFLALMSKIVFYDKKEYNYAEHLVIYGYTYSQSSIVTFLTIPLLYIIQPDMQYYSFISIATYILLHAYFLKKIFSLNTKQIILKTLLFIPVLIVFYIAIVVVFMVIFMIYLIASGQIENFIPQK